MKFLLAVLPTAGVLVIFWIAIRALVQADRRERLAQARIEAEQDAAARRDGGTAPGAPAA